MKKIKFIFEGSYPEDFKKAIDELNEFDSFSYRFEFSPVCTKFIVIGTKDQIIKYGKKYFFCTDDVDSICDEEFKKLVKSLESKENSEEIVSEWR